MHQISVCFILIIGSVAFLSVERACLRVRVTVVCVNMSSSNQIKSNFEDIDYSIVVGDHPDMVRRVTGVNKIVILHHLQTMVGAFLSKRG